MRVTGVASLVVFKWAGFVCPAQDVPQGLISSMGNDAILVNIESEWPSQSMGCKLVSAKSGFAH